MAIRVSLAAMLLCINAFGAAADNDHERGREIYNYRCYYCHGYSGDAKTLAATMMTPSPANFIERSLTELTTDQMIQVVSQGKDNTAMKGFTQYLSDEDIAWVVDFIRIEFMTYQRQNTRYHTTENGWPNHDQYAIAYPFATGTVSLDTPIELLTANQRLGFRLYMTSCISCHDRSHVEDEGLIWRARSISFPRNNYSFTQFDDTDGSTGASVFLLHEQPIDPSRLSEDEQRGQKLFSINCAFCHGEDGSGKNWIGAFLDAPPQDLTDARFLAINTAESLLAKIQWGKKDTSMPAWNNVLDASSIQSIVAFIYANADIRHAQP